MLAVAMVCSAVVTLYLGRNVDFSGDELVWVASSPGLNLDILLEPHGGHLLALTRLVYWVILENFGLGYFPFQLLAVIATLTSIGLLFAWGRKRVDDWVALGPCLVLLFFGADFLHLFQGNGFTVMLSLALGMGALLAIERGDRRGDILACALLSLGIFTYTVILPFAAGIGLMLLIQRRFRDLWIVLIPAAIYVAWRIWQQLADVASTGGSIEPASVLVIPAWVFQSLSGILAAVTGLGFDFQNPGGADPFSPIGPPLALAGLFLLGWRVSRSGLRTPLLVALTITLALWSLQALAADGGTTVRLPGGDSRYMYPGAFVVAIVAWEVARDWRPNRFALVVIALVTLSGIGANLHVMRDKANYLASEGLDYRALSGALYLAGQGISNETGSQDVVAYEDVGDSAVATLITMSRDEYGNYHMSAAELAAQPEERRQKADDLLVRGTRISLAPVTGTPGSCRPVPGGLAEAGPGTLVVESATGGEVKVGRFADQPGVSVGTLAPGTPMSLDIPVDSSETAWKIGLPADGEVCGSSR